MFDNQFKRARLSIGIMYKRLLFVISIMLVSLVGCTVPPQNGQQDFRNTRSVNPHNMFPVSAANTQAQTTEVASTVTAANSSANVMSEIDCSKKTSGKKKYFIKTSTDEKVEHVKVGATGYGAPPKNYYPEGQRRLMTIRASKIDAYRAMAEIVGGLHVWGGSAIGSMVIERDRYRVFVDTYVRGARVISVSPDKDGTYKTTVEMDVDQRFLSQVMSFIDPALDKRCMQQSEEDSFAYFGVESSTPSFYYSE